MWDLSSPFRNWTYVSPALEGRLLTTGLSGKSFLNLLLKCSLKKGIYSWRSFIKNENFLVIQWLGFCAFTAEGPGSVLGEKKIMRTSLRTSLNSLSYLVFCFSLVNSRCCQLQLILVIHSTGRSGKSLVGSLLLFSWVLVRTRFCLCSPRVCFPSPVYVLVALWCG